MSSSIKATCIGFLSIILFGTLVTQVRIVTGDLGPLGGTALIYTLGTLFLSLVMGIPDIRKFPRLYLYLGSILFVGYELCLSLSLAFSHTHKQAIEIGMVNYLWPSLTVLLSAIIGQTRVNKILLLVGIILSLMGVMWVLSNGEDISIDSISINIKDNPTGYVMALTGSILWAIYCILTSHKAKGSNGITLFFFLTALALWLKFLISDEEWKGFDFSSFIHLVMASAAISIGYGAWNLGVLKGNVKILAVASYFIPVLSSLIAAIVLGAILNISFWQGSILVCVGSLLCWWSTRSR